MIFADIDGVTRAVEIKHGRLAEEPHSQDRQSLVPYLSAAKMLTHGRLAEGEATNAFTAKTAPPTETVKPFISETAKELKWVVWGGVAFVGALGLLLILK